MPTTNPLGKQRAKVIGVEVCLPFEIERDGRKIRMTEADLAKSCGNLNPSFLPSTLALDAGDGHPRGGPAYGEVERYYMKGGAMCADIEGEADVVLEMRRGGRYPHRSMKFSRKEGVDGWYPEHICALGVMPPQIKGLAPIGAEQIIMLSESGTDETVTYFLLDGADRPEEATMAEKPQNTESVELAEYNKLKADFESLRAEYAQRDLELSEAKKTAERVEAMEIVLAEQRHRTILQDAKDAIGALDNGTNMTAPLKEALTLTLAASMEGVDEITLSEPGLEPRTLTLAEGIRLIAERLPKDSLRPGKGTLKVVSPKDGDEIQLSERQEALLESQGYVRGTDKWNQAVDRVKATTRELLTREAS